MLDARARAFVLSIANAIGPPHFFRCGRVFASRNGRVFEVRLWDCRNREVAVEASKAVWDTLTPASVAALLRANDVWYDPYQARVQSWGLYAEGRRVRGRDDALESLPDATCLEVDLTLLEYVEV